LKTLRFLPMSVLLIILLISHISVFGFLTLSITVETGKPSCQVEEDIYVCGILTHDGSPVSENSVAIEVQDPDNNTVLMRNRQTDTEGIYNLTFKLLTDAKLGTYTVYASSSYMGETATNKTWFDLVQIVQTTITIGGKDYLVMIESNATITDVTATRNNIHFKTSGPTGQTAYVNSTFPLGLNKTAITVFVDGTKLTPPPFPIITTNNTHYFIYFEFTLSTHNITIQFAPLLLGDINDDGIVDIYDAILLAVAFGSEPSADNWNPNADINGDEIVDIYDAIILAIHFGEEG
jgi:hypothetical protein